VTRNQKTEALSDEKLRELILAAGYPLEMRLFHQLWDAGFSPVHGHRVSVGEETREIDLLTQRTEGIATKGQFCLRMLIEAKKLHAPRCFVGFLGDQPNVFELAMGRAHVSGSPSWNIGHGGGTVPSYAGESGYLGALKPLCLVPYCVQWGSVCERKQGRLELAHDDTIHDDLEKTVRATLGLELEITNLINSRDTIEPFPLQMIHFPMLVLDTPTLYLYDVRNDALTRATWLILRVNLELDGRMATRFVDIVTESSLETVLTAHQEALKKLHWILMNDHTSIVSAGRAERDRRAVMPVAFMIPGRSTRGI
jgi:hypothetical protein